MQLFLTLEQDSENLFRTDTHSPLCLEHLVKTGLDIFLASKLANFLEAYVSSGFKLSFLSTLTYKHHTVAANFLVAHSLC